MPNKRSFNYKLFENPLDPLGMIFMEMLNSPII